MSNDCSTENFKLVGVLNTTKYRRDSAYRADNDNKIIDGHWCSSAIDRTVNWNILETSEKKYVVFVW